MKEPILVVLAAGMGSRYGGLKQIDPVGPNGEVLLDYSLFDARRAGFKRVIFLIKHEIEADFRRILGNHIEGHMDVRYAYQQVDMLPEGYAVPEGRVKPWGTGHAVLCCGNLIDAPFLVINSDDYYGVDAYRIAYKTLCELQDDEKARYFMIGYFLKNTLTENGYVSRGVCSVNDEGFLNTVTERVHIIGTCDGPMFTEDGETYHRLNADTLVSMNMFGFTPSLLDEMHRTFPQFLDRVALENPLKGEYYLPGVVNGMLDRDAATVQVLSSADRWYGVTYHEDKPVVTAALRRMTEEGLYPSPLWQ
ncbi:MAG: nucleotidyltransferase [Clostridia bacterium]|nr:nucleotidyltransferase [Clostridia bacterium]